MNHPLIPRIGRWIHRPFFSSQIIRNLLLIPLLTSNQGLVKFEQFFLPRETNTGQNLLSSVKTEASLDQISLPIIGDPKINIKDDTDGINSLIPH